MAAEWEARAVRGDLRQVESTIAHLREAQVTLEEARRDLNIYRMQLQHQLDKIEKEVAEDD